jgi:hypothetical protein
MAAEDDVRLNVQARRPQPQQRVHAEPLSTGAKVARGSQRIRTDEHAPVPPPERHFLPPTAQTHRQELERPESLPRDDVVGNAETVRDLRAVALVTIQQLNDAGRCSCVGEQLVVDRIDQPDVAAEDERVGAALQELSGDPAEASVELVYRSHFAAHAS